MLAQLSKTLAGLPALASLAVGSRVPVNFAAPFSRK